MPSAAAVPPRCIRIAVAHVRCLSLLDGALTIRVSGQVGGINRYVPAKIRVLLAQGCCAGVKAGAQGRLVGFQFAGEAVHRPDGRVASDGGLQAQMLCNQSGNERPSRQTEQALDEAGPEKSACAVAFACCPAECVKL